MCQNQLKQIAFFQSIYLTGYRYSCTVSHLHTFLVHKGTDKRNDTMNNDDDDKREEEEEKKQQI